MDSDNDNVEHTFDLEELSDAVASISELASEWPRQSGIYLDESRQLTIKKLPSGVSHRQLTSALSMMGEFSSISAHLLIVCWRAGELGRSCLSSLRQNEVLVACNVARALMENAAAFAVEAAEIKKSWQVFSQKPDRDTPDNLYELKHSLAGTIIQTIVGTRDPRKLEHSRQKFQNITPNEYTRTNVLTFIDKVSKLDKENPDGTRQAYDSLCDAVHPSAGRLRCLFLVTPQMLGIKFIE